MAALGLLLLAAAGLVAIVGALGNSGADHLLANGFAIFGYRVHGSSGRLFLYGAAVGAVAMLGLNMLLAGLGRGFSSRRQLRQSRRAQKEMQKERDQLGRDLREERERPGQD
jgi:membrane protein implicated in regulation of membrane protease activity